MELTRAYHNKLKLIKPRVPKFRLLTQVAAKISPEPSSAQVDNSPPSKEPSKETKLPYPSRVEHEKKGENDKMQIQKFWEMFKKIHVDITLADALILMPKPFLRTARVLIDVHGEELVIRDGMERIVFKPDGSQDKESIHMMDIYDDGSRCCEPKKMMILQHLLFFKTFSNPLFEKQDDFPSGNDESILKEEVHKETLKSHLNPLFKDDEEIISIEASRQISPKVDVKAIVSFFSQIGNCVRKWATNEFVKDNDEINHGVFKSDSENDLEIHDNKEEEIAFLDGLLENENFFETNDKKVEFLERKTKEDFETKVEPKKKKEYKFSSDIEYLNPF
ncbi:hypothetical protein Tco_0322157 [Tanacetum coccineum]